MMIHLSKIFYFSVLTFLATSLLSCKDTHQGYKKVQNGESCMNCHSKMTGFSEYHNPESIGCAACHLGNIHASEKDIAHKDMVLIPGNFQNISQTCATANCHADEYHRVEKSLMHTNSGIVSIDKFLFEEIHHTDTLLQISQLGHTAADTHLKNLCYNCHLSTEKTHYAPTDELSRGGGCLACHLNYQDHVKPDISDFKHPQINIHVDNMKCFGCHSRSGRISTNYEGWYEIDYFSDTIAQKIRNKWLGTTSPRKKYAASVYDSVSTTKGVTKYRILQDGRIFGEAPSDLHHQAGMLCIDCHSSQEIMGDGKVYKHEAEALKIQCTDCHTAANHRTIGIDRIDQISVLDYALRGYSHAPTGFISTEIDGIPLVNTHVDSEGNAVLQSKISKKIHTISPMCERDDIHQSVSCSMCHTAWAPTCIGCHSDYSEKAPKKDGTKGRWVEHVAEFSSLPPTIGVKTVAGKKEFVPTYPGMIMTLDKSNFKGERYGSDFKFVRWYAPNAAHTTTKEVRDCKSCHLNSQALGYGKGQLVYTKESQKKAVWRFEPYFANAPEDQLPQDAWIGFLQKIDAKKTYSSHDYLKPLDILEQKKMLQVGACIHCHGADKLFLERLTNKNEYLKMLRQKKAVCVVPQ